MGIGPNLSTLIFQLPAVGAHCFASSAAERLCLPDVMARPLCPTPFMVRRYIPFAFNLWKHRELLLQFTLRNVELRHKGSHLGLAWSFLNPLLLLGLYVLVF